jgi:hypothetical protein
MTVKMTRTTKKRKKKRKRKRRRRKKVGFIYSFNDHSPLPWMLDYHHSSLRLQFWLINSTAPAAKKRKIGPETSATADTSADNRVKGTKATVTDPNTYKAEKGVVVDDDEDGEGEADQDEEDEEDGEEEDDDDDEEDEGEDDEPAVKTKVVKGGDLKATAAEEETEDFDDED